MRNLETRSDSLSSLEQIEVPCFQPAAQSFQQTGGLRGGLAHHAGLNDVAGVVRCVALASQRVQHDPGLVGHAQCQRQALNQGLVVTRLACRRPETTGHHGGERALHHSPVGRVETSLIADLGHLRISQISLCGGQQALYFGGCWVVLLEPADLEQVL